MQPTHAIRKICLKTLDALPSIEWSLEQKLNVSDKGKRVLEEIWRAFKNPSDCSLLVTFPWNIKLRVF